MDVLSVIPPYKRYNCLSTNIFLVSPLSAFNLVEYGHYSTSIHLQIWDLSKASCAFLLSLSLSFRAMQSPSFYPFLAFHLISGNAGPFLLPFSCFPPHFGQCRTVPFTLFLLSTSFRAMQALITVLQTHKKASRMLPIQRVPACFFIA
jgi:hypothetical protein